MVVVIAGVGTEKGFLAACKAQEHRHKVYGVDAVELVDIRYKALVKDAPGCYYKKVDMENELAMLWEVGKIKPDMVVDCTQYPKETAILQKICKQKKWDYQRV